MQHPFTNLSHVSIGTNPCINKAIYAMLLKFKYTRSGPLHFTPTDHGLLIGHGTRLLMKTVKHRFTVKTATKYSAIHVYLAPIFWGRALRGKFGPLWSKKK